MRKVEKLSILVFSDSAQEMRRLFHLIEREQTDALVLFSSFNKKMIETSNKLFYFVSGSEKEILDRVRGIRIDKVYGGEVPDFLKPYIGRHSNG